MSKLVIFDIEEGSFERGFPVKLRIGEDGKRHAVEIRGTLPPAPNIPNDYNCWQSKYRSLGAIARIILPETQITNVSTVEECNNAAARLQSSLNDWLNKPSVQKLEWELLQNVSKSEKVRFILQTQDPSLRRLPWHLWNFFDSCYPQAEIALSAEYKPNIDNFRNPVKILALLGNSQGINVQQDTDILHQLPGAKVKLLREPSRQELTDKLWSQPWDILFFAGHSCSHDGDSSGEIQINRQESLSLDQLRNALENAVKKGLKLAIFNSCDGLGLARKLVDLRIPYAIVMREPVPDIVAQKFLQYFLTAFAGGESFYSSVRLARKRLQEELEDKYPCASWLPVIFQNPVAAELKYPKQRNWQKTGLLAATGAIAAVGFAVFAWNVIDEIRFRNRTSLGEKILVQSVKTADKEAGVQAFWFKDYTTAVNKFKKSLQQKRNDPESLIYLNNAKIGDRHALTIAVPVPIGSNPDVAQQILRGVAQAQDEVNRQGGMNGKLLLVEIANDDNDPAIAQRIASLFVSDRQISAVVGHDSSDASVAASYIYQAGELVMVSPTSTSRRLTERSDRANGNYIFRSVMSVTPITDALAQNAKTAGKTRIAICRDSKATEQSFESDFAVAVTRNGGQLIDIHCDFADTNFQPQAIIQRANNMGADSLLFNPHVDRIDKVFPIAKANQGKLTLLGNPSMQTSKTLEKGKAVNGMILAVPWHAGASADKDFTQKAIKQWGDVNQVSWRTATAYDATKVIVAGVKKNDTRMGLQQALSGSFSMNGVTGNIQFLPSGDRGGNAVPIKVQCDPNTLNNCQFVPLAPTLSLGQTSLISAHSNALKTAGVQAFARSDFATAITNFQNSLKVNPNDPETLIYLNNSLAAKSGQYLKIGAVVPINSNLNVAEEMLRGVAQAQDEINRLGGIKGKLLQVAIASDENEPNIAQEIASKFVEDQQILAVVGHNSSNAAVAAAPVYERGKLVMISPTSFSAKLSGIGKYIFRTTPSIRFVADTLSRYAIKTANKRKLAICVDEKSIDNQSFRDEFQSAFYIDGGNFVKTNCDFSAPDFNANQVISDAISNGADGLVLAPFINRINKALDLAQANQGRLALFGSSTLCTYQTLQVGQADVNAMVLAVPWHPTTIPGNPFVPSAQKLWRGSVNWRTAMAYDATVAIVTGLQSNSTRSELQNVLHSSSFLATGATGKIEFLPSGDRNGNAILVQIQPSRTSPSGYDFVPLNP